ncbi:hypothetical protein CROQUDRAFT_104861 [Cronartium quercuum f. sp. fusiforme G11]|uniref:Uncharacterized protein n=1 Tax=Cronartium quercuum f. sp. fusiforme G11 TaxID=708437 RepID=A0A9P6NPA0_9BASI|nr:hypothetical protein CROQUDRAFT_104861 [Cronartium quercuum f. sp. fusiforme G11]
MVHVDESSDSDANHSGLYAMLKQMFDASRAVAAITVEMVDASTLLSLAVTEKASKMSLQSTSQPTFFPPMRWMKAVNNGKDVAKLLAASTNKKINNLKPGRFVVRAPPNSTPLTNCTALQIVDKNKRCDQLMGLVSDGKLVWDL